MKLSDAWNDCYNQTAGPLIDTPVFTKNRSSDTITADSVIFDEGFMIKPFLSEMFGCEWVYVGVGEFPALTR